MDQSYSDNRSDTIVRSVGPFDILPCSVRRSDDFGILCASCLQCRIAAGECSLDLDKPCGICANWTQRQWGKLRRSLIDARARSTQQGRQHWSTAFPRLEAWILSKPVSTSASEISSQGGEEDFEDNVLASTPKQQVGQVLVVQAQNGGQHGVWHVHYGTQYGHHGSKYGTKYGSPAGSRTQ